MSFDFQSFGLSALQTGYNFALDNANLIEKWRNLDYTNPENLNKLANQENFELIIYALKMSGYLNDEQVVNINNTIKLYQTHDFDFDKWKSLDYTNPEALKELANEENFESILSLLKHTNCINDKQFKLIHASVEIYKNAEWKNWDWNDPDIIKNIAKNPNCGLLIDAMENTGYLNLEQIHSLKEKVSLAIKLPGILMNLKKDMEALSNASYLENWEIFRLGEKKVEADRPGSRLSLISSAIFCGISAIGMGVSMYFINPSQSPFTYRPPTPSQTLGGIGLCFSALGFIGGGQVAQPLAERCMKEGYYIKIKEIVSKNFKDFGEENNELLLSLIKQKMNCTDNGQLDKMVNKAFHKTVDAYLNFA